MTKFEQGNAQKDFTVFTVEDQVDDAVDGGVEDDQKVACIRQQIQQQRVRLEECLDQVHNEGQRVAAQEEDNHLQIDIFNFAIFCRPKCLP